MSDSSTTINTDEVKKYEVKKLTPSTTKEVSAKNPAVSAIIVETKSVDQIKKSWRLPSINYRLHRETEYQRLTFEGDSITVGDIGKAVAVSHNMGDLTNSRLEIVNSLNAQVLRDETHALPKFSSVIVKRIYYGRPERSETNRESQWDKRTTPKPRDARERIRSNRSSRSRSDVRDRSPPSQKQIKTIENRVNRFKNGYESFKKAGVHVEHHDFSQEGFSPATKRIITYVNDNKTKLLDTDTSREEVTSPQKQGEGGHELPVAGAITGSNGTNMYEHHWKNTSVYYPDESENKTEIKTEKQ